MAAVATRTWRGSCVAALAVLLIAATSPSPAHAAGAFLEEQLPLRPLSTTPSELLPLQPTTSPVTLSGRQALTAVFSRPVIALGADFGSSNGQLPPELTPFSTTCGIPGRTRWVTTSIARFDPSVEWPPDLRCSFSWNVALKAFDGAPLQLNASSSSFPPISYPPQVPLRTDPLRASLAGVSSALADQATGGLWSAETGLPEQGDGLPEVPPQANVTLSFSYPVDLRLLSDALRLRPLKRGAGRERGVEVLPCADGSGGGGGDDDDDGPRPLAILPPDDRRNTRRDPFISTCAVVRLDPPLAPQEGADLVLPRGSRYAALAGPLQGGGGADEGEEDGSGLVITRLYGLRRFRLPLRRDFTNRTAEEAAQGGYVGVSSRRLEFWLPHGLAAGTDAPRALSPLLSLCRLTRPFSPGSPDARDCAQPPLRLASLERPEKGRIVATYPDLRPGERYLLRVAGSRAVRDAFGLPLENDATAFWTDPLGDGFQGPLGGGSGGGGGDGSGVLIFEPGELPAAAGGNGSSARYAPLQWPLASRGKGGGSGDDGNGGGGSSPTVAARWAVPIGRAEGSSPSFLGRALQMVSFGQTQRAADAFAPARAEQSVQRPSDAAPSFSSLSLPGSPGSAQLVSTCCRTVEWPTKREVDVSDQLVLTTALQAVAVVGSREVVVWVSRAVAGGSSGNNATRPSAPVAGARVSVWRAANPYGQGANPATTSASAVAGMSCVTGDDGACAVPAAALRPPSDGGDGGFGDVYAVATTEASDNQPADSIIVSRLPIPYASQPPEYRGALVLDRKLVRPGEQLKVAAYASRGADGALPLSTTDAVALISPNPSAARGDYSSPPLSLPVTFDASLGTAHFAVPLPANATPGDYSLSVQAASAAPSSSPSSAKLAAGAVPTSSSSPSSFGPLIASASFTVADPRPPTADLSLDAPTWARPQPGAPPVEVELQAVSYLGGAVSGAPIDVSWRVEGGDGGSWRSGGGSGAAATLLRPGATGSVTAVTDAQGKATVRIDLSELRQKEQKQDQRTQGDGGGSDPPPQRLEVEASWVGPTRELVRRSAAVRLFPGPYRVLVERTLDTDVPGVAFGVAATALSNDFADEDEEQGGPMPAAAASSSSRSGLSPAAAAAAGSTVEVSLLPANGTASTRACSPQQLSELSRQRCSVVSPSAPRQCQLRLPCAGEFVLRACVVRAPGAAGASNASLPEPSCSEQRLGRNASDWRLSPWSRHPQLKLVPDRRPSSSSSNAPLYSEGETATLAFQNPFWGPASALVLWSAPEEAGGEGKGGAAPATSVSRRFIASVPRGANAVRIPLTRESGCAPRGCRVAVILSVGRPGSLTGAEADAGGWATLPPVARSLLFDPRAPHTASATAWIGVEPSSSSKDGDGGGPLSVELSVEKPAAGGKARGAAPAIEPLSNDTAIVVRVSSSSSSSSTPVANAQVTVLAVDEAVLDLLPYPLQDVSRNMAAVEQAAQLALLEVRGVDEQRATREAVRAVFDALRRRLTGNGGDPWLPLETRVVPGGYYPPLPVFVRGVSGVGGGGGDSWWSSASAAPADVPDAAYLAAFSSRATVFPPEGRVFGGGGGGYGGGFVGSGAPVAMAAMAMVGASRPAASPLPPGAVAKRASAGGAESNDAMADSGGSGGGSATSPAALRLAKAFVATPLYSVVTTDAEGTARVPFEAPANVGSFVVRAYAVAAAPSAQPTTTTTAQQPRYGAAETELVVARPVSLVPSLPRLARVGDVFEAGVQVSLQAAAQAGGGNDEAKTVRVTAQIVGEEGGGENTTAAPPSLELLTSPATTTVVLGGKGGKMQQEVRFRFRALAVGNSSSVLFSAALDGRVADQAQLSVPVEGKQGPVVVATSFAVRPDGDGNASSSSRGEALALPRAEPGSPSTVDLTAGVGMLPAVQAAYGSVLLQREQEEESGGAFSSTGPTAPSAVAAAALPALLSLYGPSSAPLAGGVVPSAANATASQRAAVDAAGELTDARYGLLYVSPASSASSRPAEPPTRADIALNAWGSFVVARAKAAAADAKMASRPLGGTEYQSRAVDPLAKAAVTWRDALARQLVSDAERARAGPGGGNGGGPYNDLESLSWARLALGASWSPPEGTAPAVAEDLSTRRLTAAALAGNLTVGGAARTGLLLAGVDGGGGAGNATTASDKAAAAAIARRLSGQTRVAGRTAYVAASSSGGRSAAPLADQALALRLMVALGQTAPEEFPLAQKLAAHVAAGPPLPSLAPLVVPLGGWDAALQAEALSAYDSASGSVSPDLTLTATAFGSGGGGAKGEEASSLVLLRETFSGGGALAASSSTPWSDLPANASRLSFEAKGRGEASVAALLRFTPAEMLPFASYRGLWVQRAVVAAAAGGSSSNSNTTISPGAALRAASLGDVVQLVLQVTTPDDLSDVVVEAWMPAGLEPVDENLRAAGGSGSGAGACSYGEDEDDSSSSSSTVEVMDDAGLRLRMPGSQMLGAVVSRAFGRRRAAPDVAVAESSPAFVGGGSSLPFPPWWPPVCPAQDTTPSAVRFYFPFMRAGTHTLKLRAVAATPGRFALPPTKAFAARQPEVMGLSAAGQFVVCAPGGGSSSALPECSGGEAARLAAADKPAKSCPSGCSGAGVCNLSSGECVCDRGWRGDDCSTAADA